MATYNTAKDVLDAYASGAFGKGEEALAKAEAILKKINDQLREIEESTKDWANVISEELVANLHLLSNSTNAFNKDQTAMAHRALTKNRQMNVEANTLFDLLKNMNNPMMIYLALLDAAVDRFFELDSAAESFRNKTGFLSDQTAEIESNIRKSSLNLSKFGVTAAQAAEAAESLATTFNDTAIANEKNVEYVALMRENLGVIQTDSVNVMQHFMGISGMSSETAKNIAGAAVGLATAAKVPFKAVMSDIAKASGQTLSFFRGNVRELVKATVEARRLGMELATVGSAAAKLLDFNSSISSEMEASVLFGKNINLQKARELAYSGDIAGLAREQSRILKEVGDVRKMDYFQQKALADALGLSVEEMFKMNAKQAELNELRKTNPDLVAEMEKQTKELSEQKEDLEEKYKLEMRSSRIQSEQTKIINNLKSLWLQISEILLPLVKVFMVLVKIAMVFADIAFKFLLMPFRLLNDVIDAISITFAGWEDNFSGIRSGIEGVKNAFDLLLHGSNEFGFSTKEHLATWSRIGAAFVLYWVLYKRGMLDVIKQNGLFKLGWETITTSFRNVYKLPQMLLGAIKNKSEMIRDQTDSLTAAAHPTTPAPTTTSPTTPTTPAPTTPAPTTPAPTTPAGAPAGASPSSPLPAAPKEPSLLDKIKDLGAKNILAIGAALIMFAAALWILAKAGQEFNKVEWYGMVNLGLAMTAMVIALWALGTVAPAVTVSLLPLIGTLLLFSLSIMGIGYAAKLLGDGIDKMGDGFVKLGSVSLMEIGAGFWSVAGGMTALGYAMVANSGITTFFGGGFISKLHKLASISPQLIETGTSIALVASSLSTFKDSALVEGIDAVTEAMKRLNGELENANKLNSESFFDATVNKVNLEASNKANSNDAVVKKLDELINMMANGGIAVYMEGVRLNRAQSISMEKHGSFGSI